MTLPGADFLHRFLQHVLPSGFQRLRHSGLTASRCKKAKLTLCRQQLKVTAPEPRPQENVEVFWLLVADIDIHRCPECGGRLQIIDDARRDCHSLNHRSELKPRRRGALPRCSHPRKSACHLLCYRSAAKQSPEDPPSVPAV